jgi:hypothetical protein
MGFMRVAWAALLILSAMGCAVTPQTKQSLSSYTLAMAQVEQSADMFLTDFSNGLKVQAELSSLGGAATPPKPDYPHTLQLPDDGSTPPSPAEERVRQTRQALAVVHAYNQAWWRWPRVGRRARSAKVCSGWVPSCRPWPA